MNQPIQKIVIIGGGTAGWMSASYLMKALGNNVKITLIESDSVKKLGVGEATLPSLQKLFFDFLEISEEEWMQNINGSFKSGIKYINWDTPPKVGEKDNSFYHIFGTPPTCDGIPLQQYWLNKYNNKTTSKSMHESCYYEHLSMDKNLSPKFLSGDRAMHYAWHFDAHQVADYLKDWCIDRGLNHVIDHVVDVSLDEKGNIKQVQTKKNLSFPADMYIDCSGFRSLLLQKALKEPFIDMNDQLLCDSAVAAPIPNDDEKEGIEPFTSAIAMKNGWTWKTPMKGRFGSGYVYSSNFCSREKATHDFQELWGLDDKQPLNQIKFKVGRTSRGWVKNCVGIGASSSFLEPLESTGIYFIYAALHQLVKHFPSKVIDPKLRDKFNASVKYMFDDCKDFVQMHYFTTSREDSDFWKTNKYDLKISDSIKNKMELFEAGLPVGVVISEADTYYNSFDYEFANFWTNANYYCVLVGMGKYPKKIPKLNGLKPSSFEKAEKMFKKIRAKQIELSQKLPSTYEFLYKKEFV